LKNKKQNAASHFPEGRAMPQLNCKQNKRSLLIWQRFWSSFFKSSRGGGCVSLLAPRKGRKSPTDVSFLITFFFAPLASKKKVAKAFVLAFHF
jgi:hypothetical protein